MSNWCRVSLETVDVEAQAGLAGASGALLATALVFDTFFGRGVLGVVRLVALSYLPGDDLVDLADVMPPTLDGVLVSKHK